MVLESTGKPVWPAVAHSLNIISGPLQGVNFLLTNKIVGDTLDCMSGLALQIVRNPESAAVLLDSRRQALLHLLQSKPNTATGLGKILEIPRQKVNYHLHELERAGLIEEVETKRKGNVSERIVRACATQYLISPEALGQLGHDSATQRDRFSIAFLISAASRIIRDVGILSVLAAKARKRLSTLTIETEIRFATADDRARFADELTNFVAAQAAKYHDEKTAGGRAFRLTIAAYPQITKEHPTNSDSITIED